MSKNITDRDADYDEYDEYENEYGRGGVQKIPRKNTSSNKSRDRKPNHREHLDRIIED